MIVARYLEIKTSIAVIPAQAGIHFFIEKMDSPVKPENDKIRKCIHTA